jgi:hypothetical protein
MPTNRYGDNIERPAADWFTANAAPTGQGDRYTAAASILKTALGHDPSQDQINQWANGPLSIADMQQAIYNSDEAKAYSAKQTTKGDTAAKSGANLSDPRARLKSGSSRGR